MSTTATSPVRPFEDAYLLAYSAEHIKYEFDMFPWLAHVCGNPAVRLGAPSAADGVRLSNVLIESFAIHLRNVIEFLYPGNPKPTDVVAADFLAPGMWQEIRPPISPRLKAARIRANKEIAHLTTDRITGSPPKKAWNFAGLADEVRPLLRLFAESALRTRLSEAVALVIT